MTTGAAGYHIEADEGGDVVLSLSGLWSATGLGSVAHELSRELDGRTVSRLDLSALERFDTAGALALRQSAQISADEAVWESNPQAGRIYKTVARLEDMTMDPPKRAPALVRGFSKVGRGVFDIGSETMASFAFLGRLLVSMGSTIRNPARIRLVALVAQMEKAGMDAIPIVVVTNFFIGAVVAFIGVDLLTQFGAGVFSVQLIGVSVFREFAVVITAVLLAGRSASSFAAEIGSMKMNQEVDAMQVMGVDPFQALVVPRLLALIIMLPLLTFVGMMGGLFGGMLVSWSQLSLGPSFFFQRLVEDGYMATHMMVGLIKAPVFAMVVAAIGCRQGMAVEGDVASLGYRVTAAVVQAIFAIILLDAVFALIFIELGI